MKKTRIALMVCCLALPLLAGCERTKDLLFATEHAISDIFSSPTVNLDEKSYAAADYLEQQIKEFVGKGESISASELTLVGEPAVSSELGRLVPDQVAERFRQLGYNVKPPDWSEAGAFVLGGTYDRTYDHVIVNLSMTRQKDKKTVGAFTYRMPVTREVERLATPKPRIIRMQGE